MVTSEIRRPEYRIIRIKAYVSLLRYRFDFLAATRIRFISSSVKGSVGLSATTGVLISFARFSATHLRLTANRYMERSRSSFFKLDNEPSFHVARNSVRSSN